MREQQRTSFKPADIKPNMVDRVFMRLDGIQKSANLYLFVTLEGRLDQAVFSTALQQTLEELPLLRTLVKPGIFGYARRVVPLDTIDPSEFLRFAQGAQEEAAFLQEPLDLEHQLPVRVLVTPGESTRLTVALNHSTGDASGGFFFIDRLAQRYSSLLTGKPLPELPRDPLPRSYFSHVRRLPWPIFLSACLQTARTFVEVGMPWSKAARALECATFTDLPLPIQGDMRCRIDTIEPVQVDLLKAWARAHGGTLSDLLLAVIAVVGCRVWPPEQRAVIAMLPVSLRTNAPKDVSNRVSEVSIRLEPHACNSLQEAFEAVRQATPAARDGISAACKIFERALVSHMPPGMLRPIVAKHFDRPINRTMTFVFSNLGVLDPLPGDFGSSQVVAASFIPPLSTPPGFGLGLATVKGRLSYCIGYNHPAITEASIARFCEAFAEELRQLASEASRLAPPALT